MIKLFKGFFRRLIKVENEPIKINPTQIGIWVLGILVAIGLVAFRVLSPEEITDVKKTIEEKVLKEAEMETYDFVIDVREYDNVDKILTNVEFKELDQGVLEFEKKDNKYLIKLKAHRDLTRFKVEAFTSEHLPDTMYIQLDSDTKRGFVAQVQLKRQTKEFSDLADSLKTEKR